MLKATRKFVKILIFYFWRMLKFKTRWKRRSIMRFSLRLKRRLKIWSKSIFGWDKWSLIDDSTRNDSTAFVLLCLLSLIIQAHTLVSVCVRKYFISDVRDEHTKTFMGEITYPIEVTLPELRLSILLALSTLSSWEWLPVVSM